MPRTVFASFQSEAEAEKALSLITRETSLLDSAVLSDGAAGRLTLESINLTSEERSACESQLKRGGFLMIAQADSDDAAQTVLRVLHGITNDNAPLIIAEAAPATHATPQDVQEKPVTALKEKPVAEVEEERIPIVEEELRIGKREVVRGHAVVHSTATEVPVREQVELNEEELSVENRPVNRRLSNDDVTQSGLLQDRVIQFSAMREEAVVSKESFVREEVVVTKHVSQRVEDIHEMVRRTKVETERYRPGELQDADQADVRDRR